MTPKAERLLVIGFVAIMFSILILFFLLPQQRFSELENRYLQAAPHLTWERLLEKKYAEEVELFVIDHLPFREQWLWMKATAEKYRLQQENNGIYRGKDGYLLEKFSGPNVEKLQQYIETVIRFSHKHPEVTKSFMLVPTSVGVYPERLPWLAPSYSQRELNHFVHQHMQEGVTFIDGFDVLLPHATENIYYRTDHHWTTYGAYLAYVAYAKQKGWSPLGQKEFLVETVSESFLGSYHTRSQFTGLVPDSIQAYFPLAPVITEVYIADSEQTMATMYDASFLTKKDQYSYFLGGVHGLMKLTTTRNSEKMEQAKLLVIKDSYAHNMVPFLTNHVSEIHLVDLRYYNGNVAEYLAENGIRDVLFLFNTMTFVENEALSKLR